MDGWMDGWIDSYCALQCSGLHKTWCTLHLAPWIRYAEHCGHCQRILRIPYSIVGTVQLYWNLLPHSILHQTPLRGRFQYSCTGSRPLDQSNIRISIFHWPLLSPVQYDGHGIGAQLGNPRVSGGNSRTAQHIETAGGGRICGRHYEQLLHQIYAHQARPCR